MTPHDSENSAKWSIYRHPAVRDLAWMLYAPPLFCAEMLGFTHFHWNLDNNITERWLTELDTTTEPHHSISRKNFTRLGLYCEALLKYCFEHGHRAGVIPFELIKHGFQISGQNGTLGECDFLIKNRSGKIIHLELAVKFYLQHPSGKSGWRHWIGPNSNDRLDLKLQRLFSHQLPLLQKQENKEFVNEPLKTLNIDQSIEPQHLVKGCLFFHFKSENLGVLPDNANNTLLTGFWLHASEFETFSKDRSIVCLACEKMDWLSGPSPAANYIPDPTKYIQAMYEHAAKQNRKFPPLYFLVSDTLRGLSRHPFIVVPDYWPETNSPPRRI